MKQRQDVTRVLRRIQRAVIELDRLVLAGDLTFDEAGALLAALDRSGNHPPGLTQQLAVVRDSVKTHCAQTFPKTETSATIDSVGVLERNRVGASTKWNGVPLCRTLGARVADEAIDTTSGEIKPPAVIADEVVSVLIDVAGLDKSSMTFRKGKVTQYGLNPDDYVETSGGKLSVHFTD